jgi:(p)ppGpp synthase/HD superfamily hydrolase
MPKAQFMAMVESVVVPKDVHYVKEMYALAKYGHRNQTRDGGRRYFDHPKECAIIALTELYPLVGLRFVDWGFLAVLLGHDLQEDSFLVTSEVLEKIFDAGVATDIRVLSKIPKDGYLDRLHAYGTSRCWLVKLIDRLHYLRTLDACSPEKIAKQIAETKDHILLFADQYPLLAENEYNVLGSVLKDKILEACEYYS